MTPQFNKDECTEQQTFVVPDGDYPFEVVDAQTDISKSDNEMLVLELAVDIGKDDPMKIPYVYLVFTPKALYQVKGFCAATGLMDQWEAEDLDESHCIGAKGMCHLVLGEENTKGKRYMEVGWWVEPEGFSESPSSADESPEATADDDDEPLPF